MREVSEGEVREGSEGEVRKESTNLRSSDPFPKTMIIKLQLDRNFPAARTCIYMYVQPVDLRPPYFH